MAFENVSLQITVDANAAVTQWSQAATVGSVVQFALSDNTGVNTYSWILMGRPEGSGSGGGGPEPISLGTAQTASITLDLKGAYIVWCLVNGGAPNQAIIRGGVAYLESITSPDGLPLRLLGPQETNEDISDPLVAQGWIKVLNRWLKTLSAGISSGTDQHDVRARAGDTEPAFLDTKLAAGANVTLTPITTGGVQQLQISSTGGGGASDHKVAASSTDTGPDYLLNNDGSGKLIAGANVTLSLVSVGGEQMVQISSASGSSAPDTATTNGYLRMPAGNNCRLLADTVDGVFELKDIFYDGSGGVPTRAPGDEITLEFSSAGTLYDSDVSPPSGAYPLALPSSGGAATAGTARNISATAGSLFTFRLSKSGVWTLKTQLIL